MSFDKEMKKAIKEKKFYEKKLNRNVMEERRIESERIHGLNEEIRNIQQAHSWIITKLLELEKRLDPKVEKDPPVVKVMYHDELAEEGHFRPSQSPIFQAHPGEWYDLCSAARYVFVKGDYKLINLGISIELPKGYESIIVPRSSTFKNWGILQANSIGVIDNLYSSEDSIWMFPAYATRDTIVEEGDRICQCKFIKQQESVRFMTADHLDGPSRGGFGSTGK